MLLRDCVVAETEEEITAADGKVQAKIDELKVAANDAQAVKLTEDLNEVLAEIKKLEVANGANSAQAVRLTKDLHEIQRRRLLKDCFAAETKEQIMAADGKVWAIIDKLDHRYNVEIEELKETNNLSTIGAQAAKLYRGIKEIQQRRNATKRDVAEATTSTDLHISTRALSCSAPPS